MSTYRWKARSATPGNYRWKAGSLGFAPAVADVKTTAHIGEGTAGTLNMGLWTLISGVVGIDYILKGHDNYTGGADGLFDMTFCVAGNIKNGVTIGGTSSEHVDGTYVGGGGVDVADIVLPAYVLVGHDNYVGGEAGTYAGTGGLPPGAGGIVEDTEKRSEAPAGRSTRYYRQATGPWATRAADCPTRGSAMPAGYDGNVLATLVAVQISRQQDGSARYFMVYEKSDVRT